jgi:hypothetical protein
MENTEVELKTADDWKPKVMALGTILGAAAGFTAAYMIVQQSDRRGHPPQVSAFDGVKIALLVFGLLRQIGTLGEKE